ncbi:MAG: Uma2 family endonuclease [Chloroflexi bacterium]|nr:Uma2 family endonuclease [Chloroflexota bacterium]
MSAVSLSSALPRTEIEYPESDGQPMAETDTHRDEMIDVIAELKERYRDDLQVYVAGNLLIYFEEGNPEKSVAPDVFVVFGVAKHKRRTYKIWEEGKAPDVVIEITSAKTRRQDREEKRVLYESLGVPELFLFDPLNEYLKPALQGFRLAGEYFTPLKPEQSGQTWRLPSEVLKLELRAEGGHLRLFDREAARYLLSPAEEAEARREAETEVERLKAELRKLRGESG